MDQANGENFCLAAVSYATSAARRLFEGRENPERVHLTEGELTTLLARAVEVTLDTIQQAVSKRSPGERCTSDNGGGLRCVRLAGHGGDHSGWPQETGT